jgi:hypothetical protein|tara:strand:- start:1875 stop:2132 length:258 start_codon:yes stop_codon:yes gene_type:complete
MNIIKTVMALWNLNKGLPINGRMVIKEGVDVLTVFSKSIKDGEISAIEKALIVNEIRQFSNSAIKMLEEITIPKETPKGKKNVKP